MSKNLDIQKRYLSQAVQLEEISNPRIVRATMTVISLAIISFCAWAAMTNINEVARVPGEIIPEGRVQTVQHLEGGLVHELFVREGQSVREGDTLITLDGTGIVQDLKRAQKNELMLALEEERLRAYLEGRDPNWEEFKNASPDLLQDAQNNFKAMASSRNHEFDLISQQLEKEKRVLSGLYSALKTARANADIADDLYDRRAKLNARGYSSDMQLMQAKTNLQTNLGDVARLKNEISLAQASIAEYEIRKKSVSADQGDEINQRLTAVVAEKDQNAEMLDKLRKRNERLVVKSPADGIVKGLAVNTIGEVVRPGVPLMEILPADKNLVVEIRILPQYVGNIKPGQQVQLKFSSFDFSRYGSVNGVLKQISATTFSTPDGNRFYEGFVEMDKNYVGQDPSNIILPGMTVMADVITGKKTIMDYLLKPIQRSVQTAFTER